MNAERTIRRTKTSDIPELMGIFAAAKKVMRADGNLTQWAGNYPSEDVILLDMKRKASFVIVEDGKIAGTFAFVPGREPTYRRIYKGRWLDDKCPYGTIHRIAAAPGFTGIFADAVEWCWETLPNIRVDTHRDNNIMRHVIASEGFTYCGIIYLQDGAERLAFQKIADVERLRKDARLVLPARTRSLAERFGVTPNKIFIKHNRSNWGSCSTKGNINLNLNLMRLPSHLRDYVILHELAHLREMNHGAHFHEILESMCVDVLGSEFHQRPLHRFLGSSLRRYYLV